MANVPRAQLTSAQKRKINKSNAGARNTYNAAKYTSVTIRLRRDGSDGITPETIKQAAADAGQSVNQWIIDAITDAL